MSPTTAIRIALDWTPNTIHSGLYLALEKGIYHKHNLKVELLPPDAEYSKTPARRLEDGEADLAICPSESCIAYNESGKMRLQAIYAILQKDASAIAGTKLNSMRDLEHQKTYGSYNARYEDAIVKAMVTKDGGKADSMKIAQNEGKLSMFDAIKAGKIDATWIFLPWEGIEAEMDHVKDFKTFKLEDYDIPYGYSPVIARNADKSPSDEALKAFVLATREGYQHAIDHPHDVTEILHKESRPQKSNGFIHRSQASINHYYADGHKLGFMDSTKWTAWLKWLSNHDLLKGPKEVKEEDVFDNQFAR